MAGLIKKIFGTAQARSVKKYWKIVKDVNDWDDKYQTLSEDELREKTTEFKQRYQDGETLDDLLPEAFAVVKCTCRKLCGTQIHISGYDQEWDMVPYDVQILGGISMHHGSIAEMMTGEGKTLTASMPLYLNALSGRSSHLVTVNDYLAKRDCEWGAPIFKLLGLTANSLTNEVPPNERKAIYESDIVYGTASEFGFDYLRDNSMAQSADDQSQTDHFFAIVDEIDSILIDEARTPLIISGPSSASNQMYGELHHPVARIVKLQRDLCNRFATEAKRVLDKLGKTNEEPGEKLSKEQEKEAKEAVQKLWVVGKGTPQNKVLRRIKEHPDLRAEIEKWETYFHADPNKEERAERLAELYIVVDERASEFELTDPGIQIWADTQDDPESAKDDFVMMDLGYEYAQIDENEDLSEAQKLEKKVAAREQDSHRKERAHNLRQLFRAHLLMERDVDYIIADDKIVIIDENTGRPQPGRRFSDGLHQAIEAKESVSIQQETQTYATITLQNYFRMYDKLAGMTGTAMTEANEFKEIYKVDVLEIPTHRKCVRKDADDLIYMTEREKYNAILKEVKEVHEKGRPILIGTESVEGSEKLARIFKQNKLPHVVLNAKQNDSEAEIIAKAGQRGAITIATNMAGRGTDIKLEKGIPELGGLHIIGTTRHQSRRIDRQLRGRCARQGDPGSSQFYISFEDQLMRLFASPKLTFFLQKFRPPEGEPISASILNKSIETAQKRVEQRNYAIRKHTLEYDDVMNKQRQEIYSFRNDVLHNDNPVEITYEVLEDTCAHMSQAHVGHGAPERYCEEVMSHFPISIDTDLFQDSPTSLEELETKISDVIVDAYKQKLDGQANVIANLQESNGREVEPVSILQDVVRSLLINAIDRHWQEHLLAIDHLRTEVGMRSVGQKDPLLEFKHEAFELFDRFSRDLKMEIGHGLFKFEMVIPQEQQVRASIQGVRPKQFPSYFRNPQTLIAKI
jgi:preprotein translocase subunit SecA